MTTRFTSLIFIFCTTLALNLTYAQQPISLDRPINNSLSNERNPALSADGKLIIFETDYGEDKVYPVMAKRIGNNFTRPEEILGIHNKALSDNGWCLNADGSELYFSSARYGGVGGADIWHSKRNGDSWAPPVNLAKPVNSNLPDIDPFISIDGQKLFFVRLTGQKGPTGQACGKIWMAEKSGNNWKEPKELPAPVNLGCECTPRFLNDNKTLVFASIRTGGKGGFDIYSSILQPNGTWSQPKAFNFFNSEKDDRYVSMPGKGDQIFFTADVKGKDDLFRMIVPEAFRPQPSLIMISTVKHGEQKTHLPAKITITNAKDGKVLNELFNDPSNGKVIVSVPATEPVNINIMPMAKGVIYQNFTYDPDQEQELPGDILLQTTKPGTRFQLDQVSFEAYSDKLTTKSKQELDRLVRLLQDNPALNIEVGAYLHTLEQDSVQRPELTEIRPDTVRTFEFAQQHTEVSSDQDATTLRDTVERITVRKIFHNDRTEKEAFAIKEYLKQKGIAEKRISAIGHGVQKRPSTMVEPTSAEKNIYEITIL